MKSSARPSSRSATLFTTSALPPCRSTWRKKKGYRGRSVPCPHCGQAAEFQDYRPKKPLSLVGEVSCRRAYYLCHRCGQRVFPWDEAVGLTPKRLTPAA